MKVKRTRLRSSGRRHALASQDSIWLLLLGSLVFGLVCSLRLGGRLAYPCYGSLLRLKRRRRRRCSRLGLRMLLPLLHLGLLEERDGSTGLLDLLSCGRGDRVHTHGQLLFQLTVAEELHVRLRVLEQPLLDQALRRDLGAVVEAVERADVDARRRRPERADRHRLLRRRAAQLAEPHV